MKHNRQFWTRHVGCWRASGLTQVAYCRRHRLAEGTLRYWASRLKSILARGQELGQSFLGSSALAIERCGLPLENGSRGAIVVLASACLAFAVEYTALEPVPKSSEHFRAMRRSPSVTLTVPLRLDTQRH